MPSLTGEVGKGGGGGGGGGQRNWNVLFSLSLQVCLDPFHYWKILVHRLKYFLSFFSNFLT